MTDAERPSLSRARQVIRGLYAITPDWDDTAKLVAAVEATLSAGTRLLQYRNKAASIEKKREQLRRVDAAVRAPWLHAGGQ